MQVRALKLDYSNILHIYSVFKSKDTVKAISYAAAKIWVSIFLLLNNFENIFSFTSIIRSSFTKFYRKIVSVISCLLLHLIWKNYVLYWDFDSKSWIVDFFTHEKIPQNIFSCQKFSVENNYFSNFKFFPAKFFWSFKIILS